jgi:hypothetical protein
MFSRTAPKFRQELSDWLDRHGFWPGSDAPGR